MKNLYLLAALALACAAAQAQTTSYPVSAGDNGTNSSYFGHEAGVSDNSNNNTFLGYRSGQYFNSDGNTFVGSQSGRGNILGSTGQYNTFVGYLSGSGKTSGDENTFLGTQSGYQNVIGEGNVFLGYQAGYTEPGDDKLYIANSSTTTPLIWGDFAAGLLRVNGNLAFTNALMPNNMAGSSGQVLTSAGAGAPPTWTTRSLNGQSGASQDFATGATGTDFRITSSGNTHTFSLPTASATSRGALSSADWTTFNNKESALTFSTGLTRNGTTITNTLLTGGAGSQTVVGGTGVAENLILTSTSNAVKGKILLGTSGLSAYDEGTNMLGIGTLSPSEALHVAGNIRFSGALMPSNTAGSPGQVLTSGGAGATPTWTTLPANLLLSGAAGGQTVYGGAAASENLTLSSTSNGTKGKIQFGSSVYDEVNNRLGIAVAAPTQALDVNGSIWFSGALMPNGQAGSAGQVLASAGTGVAPAWTTLPASLNSLNGLTATAQTFATGTAGTDFGISSNGATHTFNLPTASATNRGLLSSADWTAFNAKASLDSPSFTGNVGIGTMPTESKLSVEGDIRLSTADIPVGFTTEVGGTTPLLNMEVNFRAPGMNTTYAGGAFRVDTRPDAALFQWFYRQPNTPNDVPLMVLSKEGSLGIGTTTPTTKLDVNGQIYSNQNDIIFRKSIGGGGNQQSEFIGFSNFGAIVHADYAVSGDLTALSSFAANRDGTTVTIRNVNNAAALTIPSGKVGIGTTNPLQQLSITGGIGFANQNAADKKLFSPVDGTLEWVTHDAASEHGFAVSHQNQRRVYLNTAGNSYLTGGNVGIGTINPNQKLDVDGSIEFGTGGATLISTATDNFTLMTNSNSPNTNWTIGSGNGAGDLDLNKPNIFSLENIISLRSANVGIGTETPNQKLDVQGSIEFGTGGATLISTATDNFTLMTNSNSPNTNWTIGSGNGAGAFDYTEPYMVSNETYISLMSSNVGIGTEAPNQKLDVQGSIEFGTGGATLISTATDNFTLMANSNSPNTNWTIGSGNGAGAFDNTEPYIFSNESFISLMSANVGIGTTTPQYKLTVNGTAGKAGGGEFTVSSDRRLKQDISPFTDGLEKVKQIKPVWYRYNGLAGLPTEERYVGIIAQEMQEVAPYTVGNFIYQDSTGAKTEYLDYDGSAVTYMLINAIKEQQGQLETQQQQLDEQKRQNEVLQQELETLKTTVYGSPAKTPNTSGKTSAESEPQNLPEGFALYQNVPNPFDRTTVIGAQLPESVQQAKIVVYNLQGLELASYPLSERGKVSVEISGSRFPAGMYLYALLADGQVIDTKKMLLTD